MVKFEGHHAAEKGLVNVEVGSLVRLNSGSAVMTVVEVFKVCGGNNLADVVVTFFVGDEPKGFSYVLPLSSVTLVG